MADWPATGGRITARWSHGHDRYLVDGCTLCHAEYADAIQAAQNPATHWAIADPEPVYNPVDVAELLDWPDCEGK